MRQFARQVSIQSQGTTVGVLPGLFEVLRVFAMRLT